MGLVDYLLFIQLQILMYVFILTPGAGGKEGGEKEVRRRRMLMYRPFSFINAEAFGVHLAAADSFNMTFWYVC